MLNNPTFQFISEHLAAILYGGYGLLFILISMVEYLLPRRQPIQSRLRRWATNFSLYFITMVLLQAFSTMAVTNLAYFTWKNGWGLLNWLPLSPLAQFLLTLLLLDLLAYSLHVLYHKVPWGWRVHRVHHLDLDMDSSTGVLFHPLESLVSFLVRQPFVLLVGPSPMGIFLFDMLFVVFLLLTHANVRLHPVLDGVLRFFFVTPDMHRVHHSTDWSESNSNYGFSLSGWDRLFGTYRSKPGEVPEKMELGLAEYRSARDAGLLRMLVFPFLRKKE